MGITASHETWFNDDHDNHDNHDNASSSKIGIVTYDASENGGPAIHHCDQGPTASHLIDGRVS